MRKIFRYALYIALCALMTSTTANAAVGTWRNYLSYYEPQQAENAGSYLFVLASNALYQYNRNDQSITTYDKTNGMNDVYITQIAWCNAAKRLVAVYENGNIDLLSTDGDVVNLPDLYMKSMTEDKTVNSIYTSGKYAYLSTNFGIVKVNVADAEIQETYNLGFKVNYSYIDGSTIYAASQSAGTYSASLSSNIIDKSNWTYASGYVAKTKTIDSETLALIETLQPGGPKYNYCGFSLLHNGRLYICNGTRNVEDGCIQYWDGNEWTVFEDETIPSITGKRYEDIISLAIDPNDEHHLFAGARNGLYEFNDTKFTKYYSSENSPIESYNNKSKEYQLVTAVSYDNNGDLWMLNSQAPTKSIIKLSKDGEWTSLEEPTLMKLDDGGFTNKSLGEMRNLTKDTNGNLWFVNDHYMHPSFYRLSPTSEDLLSFTSFTNQDGTDVNVTSVKCVSEDKEGNIWIGTNAGPLYMRQSDTSTGNAPLVQPKVPRNDGTNLADYLLSGVTINDIEIDSANRKWMASTGSGVFLVSADNIAQEQHFTAGNSPLLSDNVLSIQIDNNTGEVFFGTDKGLCSFVSNATETNDDLNSDNVYAYPNPVRPEYTGDITIVGLTFNSDVKILSSNGTLVNSGKSIGGSFSWNGCDKNGKRVASGIYNVVTAKEDGTEGFVCKVAIIK